MIGSLLEKVSDALGGPEWLGDVLGVVGDAAALAGALATGQGWAVPSLVADLVSNVDDALDNIPTAADRAGAGQVTYPADKKDVQAWIKFIKKYGYEAIKDAIIAGKVPDEVLKDQGFQMALQDAKQAHEAYFAIMSGFLKSDHEIRMNIIRNTFA